MTRPKIMVVDDAPDIRRALQAALAPLAVVTAVSCGTDALRLLPSLKPRLMLLDLMMPEMDGIAVLQASKAVDPSLLVLMLTGESDLSVAKTTLDLGASAYITKPFELDAMCDEVSRLLASGTRGSAATPYRPWRVVT